MAAVSLFWDTNMAAMTSRENTLYSLVEALEVNVAQKGLDFYSFNMKLGADCNRNEWIQREWHWEAAKIYRSVPWLQQKFLRSA